MKSSQIVKKAAIRSKRALGGGSHVDLGSRSVRESTKSKSLYAETTRQVISSLKPRLRQAQVVPHSFTQKELLLDALKTEVAHVAHIDPPLRFIHIDDLTLPLFTCLCRL